MADVNKDRFNQRLDALKQKGNPQKRVEKRVRDDGLIVDVVKTDLKKRSLLPVKSFAIAAFLFVAFKGFVLAELGESEYLNRVDTLKKGGAVQVSAAFLLDADPATRAIAGAIGKVMR
ncbi:hypothetical protein [uncultured Litoreibacter sp.]|uniref:hypothetical protein n=1 Tax=uncultured Litoreibacter sp. TaxID=1392394 RepID=UPI0026035890|nr:hypothetical protein [uncultured Litoreibacter sp.]